MDQEPRHAKTTDEYFEAIHEYFRFRVLGLAYILQGKDKSAEFKIASGFVLEVDETHVVVTAGHVCKELQQASDNGTLCKYFAIFAASKFEDECFELDPTSIDMYWWDFTDDLDIGFAFISRRLADRLRARGVVPISSEAISPPQKKGELVQMAIGFSADGCIVTDTTLFHVVNNGKTLPVLRTELAGAGRRIVLMKGFTVRRNSQFIAQPLRPKEPCVTGMSGGVVIQLQSSDSIRDFKLIGIQSAQLSKQLGGKTIATEFYVNDAMHALSAIRAALRTLVHGSESDQP